MLGGERTVVRLKALRDLKVVNESITAIGIHHRVYEDYRLFEEFLDVWIGTRNQVIEDSK